MRWKHQRVDGAVALALTLAVMLLGLLPGGMTLIVNAANSPIEQTIHVGDTLTLSSYYSDAYGYRWSIQGDAVISEHGSTICDIEVRGVKPGDSVVTSFASRGSYVYNVFQRKFVYQDNGTTTDKYLIHVLPNTVQIMFDAGASKDKFDSLALNIGDVYGQLPQPKLDYYQFIGWYTELEGGEEIKADTKMTRTENHTLYAHYQRQSLYVRFDAGESKDKFEERFLLAGNTYGKLPQPTLDNYLFDGWYTRPNGGGVKIEADTRVTATSDHTLYAYYLPERVTVTFDAVGGFVAPDSKTVANKQAFGELPVPSKSGSLFLGWYTEQDGGELREDTDAVSASEDFTLYAHWLQETVTVTFDANGGSVTPAAKTLTNLEAYGELPVPVYDNHDFQGWYTSKSGGSKIASDDVCRRDDDFALYAHWKGKTVTISFDANGGTSPTADKTVEYGMEYGELPVPVKQGSKFCGWSTAQTGGKRILAHDAVSVAEDHILYAIWVEEVTAFSLGGRYYSALSSLYPHSAYIDKEGDLWMWGENNYGLLGNGTTDASFVPVKILTNVADVYLDSNSTVALKKDGSLWTWGENSFDYGNLGNGTTDNSTVPVKILDNVRELSSFSWQGGAAIKKDSSLWMWGRNDSGQLGNDSLEHVLSPIKVLDNVSSVLVGGVSDYTYAIKNDHTLWMWGEPMNRNRFSSPKYVMNNVKEIAVTGTIITTDNNLWEVRYGEPVQISEPIDSPSALMSIYYSPASKEDGSLWVWGSNFHGQWGTGDLSKIESPMKLMDDVSWFQTQSHRTAILKTDGSLWMCGYNRYGQVGNGGTDDALLPCRILDGVKSVHLDDYGTLALKQDGTLWGWGWISGFEEAVLTPVQILDKVKGIEDHNAVTREDGTLWMWGSNNHGQLGIGTTEMSRVPVQVGKIQSEFTVRFNPNGGEMSDSEIHVTEGEVYGTLPTPIKDGFAFEGWYTESDGGYLIEPETFVSDIGVDTLYAHWKTLQTAPEIKSVVLNDDRVVTAQIICPANDITVYCATYDVAGKMIAVRSVQVTSESNCQFQFDGQQFDYAKVFILDSNFCPLCESKRT